MTERTIDANLKASLMNNDAFIYYNLIKFERPQLSTVDGGVPATATDYAYLTDAPFNVSYDDGSGNGTQVYVANKILNIGSITESIEAKATTMSLKLSTAALGAWVVTTPDITAGYIEIDGDWALEGFREGDKVLFDDGGTGGEYYVIFNRFTIGSNGVRNSRVYYTNTSISVPVGGTTEYTISIASEEIQNIVSDKTSTNFSSYLNREVIIRRVHANPETGAIIGTYGTSGALVDGPWVLFRGIIANSSVDEKPNGQSSITWGLSSHWGDFVRANGRLTSDSAHRALGASGRPDTESIIRPEYATDYGFAHAERAVNVMAQFSVKELRYKYQDASFVNKLTFGLFGSGPKQKEEWVDVERDVDLRFNLNARYLPVVYGVQLIENNPVFVDVNAAVPEEVYIAYALCEGEIGGILDIYIEDQPSVCLDTADSDARGEAVAADQENNVDVICYGRADKGDVLSGGNYLTTEPEGIPGFDVLDVHYTYFMLRHGSLWGRQLYLRDFTLGTEYTSPSGLTHESQFTFTTPIDATLMVHTGKPDQEANQELLSLAQNTQFKIQQDYFLGDPSNYWSTSHRLLDTAYVVGKFTLGEGEDSVPEYKFVVKGKYINCYNYDGSYRISNEAATTAYKIGQTVNLSVSGGPTYNNVQIIDKFTLIDKDGNEDVRFRWMTNWPNPGDTLIDIDANQTLTMSATAKPSVVMRPYNYSPGSGAVIENQYLGSMSGDPNYTDNSSASTLTATFTGASFLTMVAAGGAGNVYISPTDNREVSFLVTNIIGGVFTFAAYSGASELLKRYKTSSFVISNGIIASSSAAAGNKLNYHKTINGATETKEKIVQAVTGSYIFTKSPFGSSFYPESGDTFDIIDGYEDLRVSINPAMQLLDYVTSKRYGQGLDVTNDLKLDTWLESGRLCDDRSKVKIVTTTVMSVNNIGDVYTYSSGGDLKFQGTVYGVSSHSYGGTTYYEVEFDNIIGKLGYKWNDWKTFSSDVVWFNGFVRTGVSGQLSDASSFTASDPLSLTRIGGGSLEVYTQNLGGVPGTNPIVRAWSEDDQAFSLPGYSLYDSDDVIYWKYLGWDQPEQRYVTRHQMNQTVSTSGSIFDNVNTMLTQFNGMLRYVNGKYELDVRTAAQPVNSMEVGVHRLSEDDIIGDIKLDDKGIKKSYNSISASISDPQNKFANRSVTFFDSRYLKEDRGITKQGRLTLPGITNYYNARTNIVQFLQESRYGLTINFTMDQKGYLLLPGEVIALNYGRFLWYDKYFRIESMDVTTNGIVRITAKEHNDAAYLLDYTDRDLSYTSGSNKGAFPLAPPITLTASTGLDGAIQLAWINTVAYNPATYDIEIWAAEALKDSNGDLIRDSNGDPTGNEFSRATFLDKADGSTYLHNGLGEVTGPSDVEHVWFYWIRYVKPPLSYRTQPLYSRYEPVSTGLGVEGRATDALLDSARTVTLTPDRFFWTYDDAGNITESPTAAATTVTAEVFGAIGVPYYQFFIYDVQGGLVDTIPATGPSTANTFEYEPPITIESNTADSRWMPETIRVEVREDDPGGGIHAIDVVQVFGLQATSEAIFVSLSNPVHVVFVDEFGFAQYGGSGTTIEVLEGDQVLDYVTTTDLDPGQFKVSVELQDPQLINPSLPGTWFVDSNGLLHIADHDGMTADQASIVYDITVQRSSGLETTFNRTQNFTKIKDSNPPKLAQLLISDHSVVYDEDGLNPNFFANTAGNIVITAITSGFDDPYVRVMESNITDGTWVDTNAQPGVWYPVSTDGTFEYEFYPPTNFVTGTTRLLLDVKEGATGVDYVSDSESILYVKAGTDGLSGLLSNESHLVATDNEGNFYNLTNAGGVFEVFSGAIDVTDQCAYYVLNILNPSSYSNTYTQDGLTMTISNLGEYTLTDTTPGWSASTTTFELLALYNGAVLKKTYTISKSFAGANGLTGRTSKLLASDHSVVYDSFGENPTFNGDTSGTNIILTASSDGYVDPEYQLVIDGVVQSGYDWTPADTDTTYTFLYPVDQQYNIGTTTIELETREGGTGSASSADTISIAFLKEGTGGLSGGLTNENHSESTLSDGTGYDLADAGGQFEIFSGGTDVIYDPLTTFSILGGTENVTGGYWTKTQNGLVMTIDSSGTGGGLYTLTDTTAGWTSYKEVFTLQATYDGDTVTKKYTITKARGGEEGGGAVVSIYSDDYTVLYDDAGGQPNFNGSTDGKITLTAESYGFINPEYRFTTTSGTITFDNTWQNPTSGIGTSDFTVPLAFDTWVNSKSTITVEAREFNDNSLIVKDALTIYGVSDNTGAFTIVMTNPNQGISELNGTIDFDHSDTFIQVYEGATLLDFAGYQATLGSAPDSVANKWSINSFTYGGALVGSSYPTPVNANYIYPAIYQTEDGDVWSAFVNELIDWQDTAVYSGYTEYELHIRRKNETSGYTVIDVRQNFTRNVVNDTYDGYSILVSNDSHPIPCDAASLGYTNPDWSGSATDFQVARGTTPIAYQASLTANDTYKVVVASNTAEVVPNTTPNQLNTYTVRFGPHDHPADNKFEASEASITYNVTIKGPDGVILGPYPFKQSFVRMPQPVDGSKGDPGDSLFQVVPQQNTFTCPCDSSGDPKYVDGNGHLYSNAGPTNAIGSHARLYEGNTVISDTLVDDWRFSTGSGDATYWYATVQGGGVSAYINRATGEFFFRDNGGWNTTSEKFTIRAYADTSIGGGFYIADVSIGKVLDGSGSTPGDVLPIQAPGISTAGTTSVAWIIDNDGTIKLNIDAGGSVSVATWKVDSSLVSSAYSVQLYRLKGTSESSESIADFYPSAIGELGARVTLGVDRWVQFNATISFPIIFDYTITRVSDGVGMGTGRVIIDEVQ